MSEIPQKYTRRGTPDNLGKLPPSFTDAEERLLGTYMQAPSSRKDFINRLSPEMLYNSDHQFFYSLMIKLHASGRPVDIITLKAEAQKTDPEKLEAAGGIQAIARLLGAEAGADRVEHYIDIVRGAWMLREMIRVAYEINQRAYDLTTDPGELMSWVHEELLSMSGQSVQQTVAIYQVIEEVFRTIEKNRNSTTQFTGVGTGFTALDRHTGGMQPGDLVVVAGETSNGKTAFAINIAVNAAELGSAVGIFSLEMTNRQNVSRMIATRSKVSAKSILMHKLSDAEFDRIGSFAVPMMELPIYFDDTSSYQIDRLCEAIRAMVIRHSVKIVMIDYLQLIRGNQRATKTEQVAEIANELKRLANSLKVPIVLLSQLSRSDNPKPTLQRLKGSGDIENAADLVIFVMRPELYNITDYTIGGATYETKGLLAVDVAKGRNYGLTEFPLSFFPEEALITDLIIYAEAYKPISPEAQLNF